jgi:predicted dehydrogenase
VTTPERVDPLGSLQAVRALRASRRHSPPTMAVVADSPDDSLVAELSAAGWEVVGLAAHDVFEALLWASRVPTVRRSYVDLVELLLDVDVDAVCLAVPASQAGSMLAAVVRAGLPIVLAEPAEVGTATLREVMQDADVYDVDHAVALRTRAFSPFGIVADAIARGAIGRPLQITVRGWWRCSGAIAELVDVVRRWAGDPVAVCAAHDALPAPALPDGTAVQWALLTETGTTVLVAASSGDAPLLRLSGPWDRIDVTLTTARHADGSPIEGPSEPGSNHTAVAVAAGALAAGPDGVDAGRAATLAHLFVAERVREALRESLAVRQWVEL